MSGAVAQRYASALADVVLEENLADFAKGDFAAFSDAFYSSADLRNFLESPAIGEQAKQKAIGEIAAKMGLCPPVRNFVRLIVKHRRTEMIREIQQAFRRN